MRIRTIKPEFFTHERLFDLERETGLPVRLAYIGLWCAADREGRFKWEPRRLGVSIMPYDEVDFSRVLDALATRGFIVHYACDSREFGCIPSFSKHQVINNRERLSELPELSQSVEIEHIDASGTREPRDEHAGKAEGKGREGKGIGKGTKNKEQAEWFGFDEFWQAYPKKVGKAEAQKCWSKIKPDLQAVLKALSWQKSQPNWTKDGGQFIPNPSTYLNQGRYNDEPLPEIAPTRPTRPCDESDVDWRNMKEL